MSLKQGQFYPVADRLEQNDLDRLQLDRREVSGPLTSIGIGVKTSRQNEQIKAIWNGGKQRKPKQGEWYLSGKPIDAVV